MPQPKECAMKNTIADNVLFIGLMFLTLVCLSLLWLEPDLRNDDTFKTLSQAIVITGLIGLIGKAQQDQQAKQTVATTTAVAAAVAATPTAPSPTNPDVVKIDTAKTEITSDGPPTFPTGGPAPSSLGAGNGVDDDGGDAGEAWPFESSAR